MSFFCFFACWRYSSDVWIMINTPLCDVSCFHQDRFENRHFFNHRGVNWHQAINSPIWTMNNDRCTGFILRCLCRVTLTHCIVTPYGDINLGWQWPDGTKPLSPEPMLSRVPSQYQDNLINWMRGESTGQRLIATRALMFSFMLV